MSKQIVFIDIAGPDDEQLKSFYAAVFGWTTDEHDKFEVDIESPVHGAFRKDPAEKRLYIGVDDVAACLEEVEAHGGSVDQPRFEVPGVVVLGLFRDPAGNPMGLVEMDGMQPRIP